MAESQEMGTQETQGLMADLFGSDSEQETQSLGPSSAPAAGAAASSSAAPAAAPLTSQEGDLLEQDLFGDFDSGNEAPSSAPAPPAGGRLKRVQAEPADAEAAPAPAPSRPPKKRRTDLHKFADLEAEEADGDSGDEAEGDDLDDLIEAGAGPEVSRSELRRAMQQQSVELEEAKQQAAAAGPESGVRRVYGSGYLDRMQEKYEKAEQDAAAGLIPEPAADRASLPSKTGAAFVVPDMEKDPKLWMNKTFAPEVDLCIAMMVKAGEALEAGLPVPMSSVFFAPHLRGYVYIEADNEVQIRNFTNGVRGFSTFGISLVPTNQMPQVFEASVLDAAKKKAIKVGDFVRLKRGLYIGDLGEIDEVKDQSYIVKLKPRLQMGSEQRAAKLAQGRQDRAAKARPPQRWFNKMDVEADGTALVNVDWRMTPRGIEHFYTVDKELYRDGFLYKEFKSTFFDAGEKVRPQQTELQDKRSPPPINENTRPAADLRPKKEEHKMLPPASVPKKTYMERTQLEVGDQVIVTSGDVKNLRAVVTQALFKALTVWVRPTDPPSSTSMSLEVSILSKFFSVGDYVKVLSGQHEGDTGYVVKVVFHKPNVWDFNTTAIVLSQTCSAEFKVRIDHLQLTCEDAEPQDEKGEFQVGQLVRLDGQNDSRALVTRIEANSRVAVLATDNKTYIHDFKEIQPVSLPKKKQYQNNLWTLDRKGQKIRPGCVVHAPQAGIKGEPISAKVLYIHDNYVFLQATEALTGDAAFSACQGGKCEYFWDENEIRDAERENENKKKELEDSGKAELGAMSYGIKMASETSWLKPHLKRKMGVDKTTNPTIFLKGAAVRIHGGSYKGLRAEVRESLGDKLRCSLLSINKLVIVAVEHVAPDDYWHKEKAKRWPSKNPAPSTPPVEAMPGSPVNAPRSPGAVLGDDDLGGVREEDMWNPHWDPDDPDGTNKRLRLQDGSGGAPPASPGAAVSTEVVGTEGTEAAERSTTEVVGAEGTEESGRRKRRVSRLPQVTEQLTEQTPHMSSILPSPSAAFGKEAPPAQRDVGAPWLMVGAGVTFTWDDSYHKGWIRQVFDSQAYIQTNNADGDTTPFPLDGKKTKPWHPESADEDVIVFDGPHRGLMGKVIGFETLGSTKTVFLRCPRQANNQRLADAAVGKYVKRVEFKDVAKWREEAKLLHQPGGHAEETSPVMLPSEAPDDTLTEAVSEASRVPRTAADAEPSPSAGPGGTLMCG